MNLWLMLPEMILGLGACLILLAELGLPWDKKNATGWIALMTCLVALFTAWEQQGQGSMLLGHGMMALDGGAVFFKLLLLSAGALVCLFSLASQEIRSLRPGEYYAILLSTILGTILMASAADLILLFLALEMVGILSYILVGFHKKSPKSSEAALKYLIYGSAATGVMLFGMTYLYGLTGTTQLPEIAKVLAKSNLGMMLSAVMLFILVGFGFKIAMVPFHMWCPDVYEGAPTPVTAFLSVAPKAAGFAVLIRFFYTLLAQNQGDGTWALVGNFPWPTLLAIASAFTMTIGNLSALTQQNAKRMLAYSSIAHAGYILMGFVVLERVGLQAILFYLVIYLFMNVGAFLCIAAIRDGIHSENIDDYKGLGKRMPFVPVFFAIFLFSLVGLPPLAGFIAKFNVFAAVIHEGMYWLVAIAIVNSVVSLYYYARILKALFLEESAATAAVSVSFLALLGCLATVLPTCILGVYWQPLLTIIDHSFPLFGG